MKLVGMEGEAWDSVAVHKAVILPLCPLLNIMEKDVTKEDPVVILPDHPLELLRAFVKLIYKGSAATSDVVTMGSLLELMASLGLNMPVNRLMISREEVDEIEVVGFKKRNGLEIIEVNNNLTPLGRERALLLPCDQSSSRKSLEITPCLLQPPAKRRNISKALKTPASASRRKLRGQTSEKMENEIPNPSAEVDVDKDCNDETVSNELVAPIEVKLECEEFTVEDVQPSKKRKWNRRRETLDIPLHACEFCDYKCRFMKSLQEHSDQEHTDKDFNCAKCEFKAASFAGLRVHNKKKHVGEGVMVCEVCGFRANKKRDMAWHKANLHVACNSQSGLVISKDVDENSLQLKDIGDQTLEDLDIVVDGEHGEMVEAGPGIGVNVDNDATEEPTTKQLSEEEEKAKESDETHNMDLDNATIGILVVDAEDSTIDDAFHAEEDGEEPIIPKVCKIDKSAAVDPPKADTNHGEQHDHIDESKMNDEDLGKDKTTAVPEQVAKNSGELVGFQCGAPGCSRVSRVKFTTATYALNRLKTHHAKVHKDLEESEFSYINLFKEETKIEPPKQKEENPLQILKKVKASHKKASPKPKIKPVQVRIKKGTEVDDEK